MSAVVTPPTALIAAPAAPRFTDVLDIVDLLRRRLALRGRERLIERVAESGRDFEEGRYRIATVEEIMREADS